MKESKVFTENMFFSANDIINERVNFGWEMQSISETRVAMTRNTEIPNYAKIVELEKQYDWAMNQAIKYHNRCGIRIPLIIRTIITLVSKKKKNEMLAYAEAQVQEAYSLLQK